MWKDYNTRLREAMEAGIREEEEYLAKQQERIRQEELWQRRRQEAFLRREKNPQLFLETEGIFTYDPQGKITSQKLYQLYSSWCNEENLSPHTPRAFWQYVKEHASQYHLVYSVHIPDGTGKRVRGFYGIRPLTDQEKAGGADNAPAGCAESQNG